MQYVPPRTMGNIESMIRTLVTSGSSGMSRRFTMLSGSLTGQSCCIVTEWVSPSASFNTAIS
jgi:hypothetical protein